MTTIETKLAFKLQSLRISRGTFDNKLSGTVEISGRSGKTEFRLKEEKCQKIIDICADIIIDHAKEIAAIMKEDIASTEIRITDQSEGDK